MSQNTKVLIIIHVILLIFFIPYAFVSWLLGIIPKVYTDPGYWINLVSIALYELSAFAALLSLLSKKIRSNELKTEKLLRIPLVFAMLSGVCLIYLLIKYWH